MSQATVDKGYLEIHCGGPGSGPRFGPLGHQASDAYHNLLIENNFPHLISEQPHNFQGQNRGGSGTMRPTAKAWQHHYHRPVVGSELSEDNITQGHRVVVKDSGEWKAEHWHRSKGGNTVTKKLAKGTTPEELRTFITTVK